MQRRTVGSFLAVCLLVAAAALASGPADPVASRVDPGPEPASAQPQVLSFKALSTPSDGQQPIVSGAVGLDSILVVSERRLKQFDKAGNPTAFDVDLDAFFGYVAGTGIVRLPQVQYDRFQHGFWVVAATAAYPSTVLLARSLNENPLAFLRGSWSQASSPPAGDALGRIEALSLGVDRQALYIGTVLGFGSTPRRVSSAFVVRKDSFQAPGTAFRDLTDCSVPPGQGCHGDWAPVGVSNDDPDSQEGYFISTQYGTFGQLQLLRISNPGSNAPTLSDELVNILFWGPIGYPWWAWHLGGDQTLTDFVAPALTSASVHKDKITGKSWLTTALVEGVGGDPDILEGRWYRIGDLTTHSPGVYESGRIEPDVLLPVPAILNPTVAMSGQGHVAIGATSAAGSEYLNAVTTGRHAGEPGDPLTVTHATVSANAYTPVQVDPNYHPWTHTSATVVDPRDDMTMWTFQPWCDADDSIGIQVIKLAAPPPPAPEGVVPWCAWNPLGLPTVFSVTNPAPKGFFDPGNDSGGPGYPNRFSATISGGVQLLVPPTVIQPDGFAIEIDPATATPGLHSVTVTNPDGQSATGTNVLNVLALVPDPILSNSGPVCETGTAQLFLKPAPGTPPGAQSFAWFTGGVTLPTPVSDQQNPVLTGVTLDQAGLYDGRLHVAGDTCGSTPTYTDLQVLAEGTYCCPGAPFSNCFHGRCMPDFDGDGRSDFCDSCPTVPGLDFTDSDGDGIGDLCDNCPANGNPGTGPLDETFELSPAGFTPIDLSGGGLGTSMTWAWSNTRCGGTYPSKGWRTFGAAGPTCNAFFNQEDSLLLSPILTIPIGHSTLAFDAIGYDLNGACLNSGQPDAKEVVLVPNPQFPTSYTTISGCAYLTQGTGVVTHNEFDLSIYSGMTVQIGFRYRSDLFSGGSQGWMVDNLVIRGSSQSDDLDGDAHGGPCDCAPSNASTWGTVDEALNLQVAATGGGAAMTWDPPAGSYGVAGSVAYDVIRSTNPNDFTKCACVETNDASDTAAFDPVGPSVGTVFYYVVRPENACGQGIAWRDSTGAPREACSCP